MRHKVKGRHLSRTSEHRLALLRGLAMNLFKHKRIKTTVQKAKEARKFIEPIITKAKEGSVHSRRLIMRDINQKAVYKILFDEIVPKVMDRAGGYTRIVKLGNRHGDAAEMAILELVDFNDVLAKREKKEAVQKEEKGSKDKVEDAKVIEETTEKKKTSKPKKQKAEGEKKPKAAKKKTDSK